MDKKISVITVCYNSEKTIEDTFKHMLSQKYKNIEYIVVDGKSTDRTTAIIEEYAKKFPFAFKYISERDGGIYDAMNKGILMATGDLIGINNSDDWYEDDALSTIASFYDGSEYEVIYGMTRFVSNERMEKRIAFYNHNFLPEQMICHSASFVTKKVYENLGLFDSSLKSSADYKFMLKLYDSNIVKFIPVHKVISNFREGGMSSSQIGFRETQKIKYDRGQISKYQYLFNCLKSKLKEML